MSIWGDHKDIRKAATELQHNKKVTQQRLVSQRLHVPELLVSVMVSVLRCWRFLVPCEVSRSCGNSAPLKAAHSFMDVDISIPSLDQIRYFAILVFPNVWVNSIGNNLVLESNCPLSYLSVTQSEFINAFGSHVIVPLTCKVYNSSFCVILG